MTCNMEKDVLLSVIESYKDMPYLWQKNHKDYMNKDLREEGFKKLLEIYKQYNEEATTKMLKKKIENMRTYYMKELKQVLASKEQQSDAKRIPTIWYYDALSFLDSELSVPEPRSTLPGYQSPFYITPSPQHSETERKSADKSPDSQLSVHIKQSPQRSEPGSKSPENSAGSQKASSSSDEEAESVATASTSQKRQKMDMLMKKQENILLAVKKIMTRKEKPWHEVYGRSIGHQMKGLDECQLAIAQKMISDVIFHAKFKKLRENSSVVLNPDEKHNRPNSNSRKSDNSSSSSSLSS